jgi:hypothetical protein
MHCSALKDDGSLRFYCPPDTKVVRAIRGLDSEVSSVTTITPNNGGFGHVWVACGSSVSVDAFLARLRMYHVCDSDRFQVKNFNLNTPELVQSNEHALDTINVGENEGDVTNEAGALDISSAFSENLPSDICQ